MMSIDLSAYSDRFTFDSEITSLFSQRLFVGTSPDFPEQDSYRSFSIGKKIITVRRTIDGIKTFSNVCLHRSNIIDPFGEGKRHFSCGFHGWSYDSNGELYLAPFTEKNCIKHRSLPSFPTVDSAGLIFAGLSGETPQTDHIPAALERIKISVNAPFHKEQILHYCNWKLLVENVLEGYHLNFVHRNTFLRSGFASSSTHQWEADGYVSIATATPLANADRTKAIRRLAKDATHIYRHAYIFPNLFISNTNDLIGFVSHLLPVDEKTTLLSWELFELPQLTTLPDAIRQHLREEAISFSRTALAEDKCMVESCQIGITSDTPNMQLQPVEDRVSYFHDYYVRCMNHAE